MRTFIKQLLTILPLYLFGPSLYISYSTPPPEYKKLL